MLREFLIGRFSRLWEGHGLKTPPIQARSL